MSITDELREYTEKQIKWLDMTKVHYRKLFAIADRIDAEHERVVRERRRSCVYYDPERHYCSCHDFDVSGYVELPKDADGEPIRVGDVMDKGEVTCIRDCGKGWEVVLNNLYTYDTPSLHHHKPTVEDVLREFADEMNQNLGMYTGEVIDADEWRDADAKTVEKFAAKLRLAEEVE